MNGNPLLIILGPTASGKTRLAVQLADAIGTQQTENARQTRNHKVRSGNIARAEIISADSRQVFKGMDIGTGKDLNEYKINGKLIPYHLIDIKQAGDHYNVNEFKEDFYAVFNELTAKNILPILCGGTGMYIHSLLQQHEYTAIPVNETLRLSLKALTIEDLRSHLSAYPHEFTGHADLSSHKRLIRAIEISNYLKYNTLIKPERPVINPLIIGLESEVILRRNRIAVRLEARFKAGMIEEVKTLLDRGISKDMLTFYGLEYKFIAAYLFGEMDLTELKEKLTIAICQYAKRQMTFFRKMEKDGVYIHWLKSDNPQELVQQALAVYQGHFNAFV
ncbi:tRNA (adenosine(37)-N6)-dimethylallyltransferase [Pedobacter metabolipauper]|uniref:tRNA dimethylallyltransferase n=1 Tax=Pedobacter metabolipauper TaxID=425513 RepID=A0A4R6SZB0_9SPHI|nr:tRNA (adenosine(37)-N6)-dimethylallyltransferase MiaA [Pedobacter metabolipauper]TDQ11974.1 tRNA dimethylallyltransferase [Pedobacter metabolipauper]